MLTKEQIEGYIRNPNHCPFCGSKNISASNWDSDTGSQEVECKDCCKMWYDFYRLIDIEEKE